MDFRGYLYEPAGRGPRLLTNFLCEKNSVYMESGPAQVAGISLEPNGAPG